MKCSFSNEEIPKGTGLIYVKKDGTTLYFKNQKAKKNMLGLGRIGKKVKWTSYTKDERGRTMKKSVKAGMQQSAPKQAKPAEKKVEAKPAAAQQEKAQKA